jgi:hypothetical protein
MQRMDYGKILNRAWDTVWRYKTLWIFGAVLALTTGGGSSGAEYYGLRGDRFRWETHPYELGLPPEAVPALIGVGIALLVVGLAYVAVALWARYVAETSLIGMVDAYEESGEKKTVRQGFRMGRSRAAWRLFLIDLLVGVPVTLAMLAVFAAVAAPAFLWLTGSEVAGAIGTAVTVLLFIPALLLAVLVGVSLAVLMRFFRRACVIEGLGVRASIRRGFAVARQGWGNVGLVWLIMAGVGVAWAIIKAVLFFVLLPVLVVTITLGIALGGLPALIAFGVASLASRGAAEWIPYLAAGGVGLGVGLPVLVLFVGAPWFFVDGLMQVFASSVWTQTYRELRAQELVAIAALPELEATDRAEEEAA